MTLAARLRFNTTSAILRGSDTVNPQGKWLVSMNKWSVERFNTSPLLAQISNLSISRTASDACGVHMPIGFAEPHYAQIIPADNLTVEHRPQIDEPAQTADVIRWRSVAERIERNGDTVEVFMTSIRSH